MNEGYAHKFYEPTENQKNQRKMQDIMSKLQSQESVIMKMLEKYNQSIPNIPLQASSIKNASVHLSKQKQRERQKSREQRKLEQQLDNRAQKLKKAYEQKNSDMYALPTLKHRTIEHRKSKVSEMSAGQSNVRSARNRNLINSSLQKYDKYEKYEKYYDAGNSEEEKREIIRDHLFRKGRNSQKQKNTKKNLSYTNSIELKKKQLIEKLNNKPQTNTFPTKALPEFSKIPADQELENILKEETSQNFIQNQLSLNHEIMKPLSVPIIPLQNKDLTYSHNQQPDSDSDSNEQGVTLKFYTRELDNLFTEQCKEQLNFLFFSKTAEMKEWSASSMQLFKKHDQQLEKLHKRNQYLKTFDDTYFKTELYRDKK